MPNDSKLYLCFEYCDYDLKKYMKSCQYKLSANCIKARHTLALPPRLCTDGLLAPCSPSRTRC